MHVVLRAYRLMLLTAGYCLILPVAQHHACYAGAPTGDVVTDIFVWGCYSAYIHGGLVHVRLRRSVAGSRLRGGCVVCDGEGAWWPLWVGGPPGPTHRRGNLWVVCWLPDLVVMWPWVACLGGLETMDLFPFCLEMVWSGSVEDCLVQHVHEGCIEHWLGGYHIGAVVFEVGDVSLRL